MSGGLEGSHLKTRFVRRFRIASLFRVTTTVQPLWEACEPQSEQRRLILLDSFFLFLPRLSGKTILSESTMPPVKGVSMVQLLVIERLEQLELWNAWNLS